MKLHIIVTAILGLSMGCAVADSATDLLDKVKAKYSGCQTFYCEGKIDVISNMRGKDNPFKTEKKFSIRFQRPASLRVDWVEPSMASFSPVTCSLYTENGKYFGIPSFRRTPEEFKDLDTGIGAYAGISGGATYFIPSFLISKKGYFNDYATKLLADSKVADLDCATLEVKDKKSGTWTLAVDKTTFAIVRSNQVQVVSAEQSRKNMEEARKALKNKDVPLPEAPTEDYSIETTVDYTPVIWDQKIEPSEFIFKQDKN